MKLQLNKSRDFFIYNSYHYTGLETIKVLIKEGCIKKISFLVICIMIGGHPEQGQAGRSNV